MEILSDEKFKSLVQSKTKTTDKDNTQPIHSLEEFKDWKDDFLDTFRQYLNPEKTAVAREVDEELYSQLEQLAKALRTTQELIDEGKISPDASTVSGQKTMNEMIALVKSSETAVERFVPKTKVQEQKCGYTKFELAAVLIRDGFSVYGLMVATRDILAALVTEGGGLSEILRPNQLTIVMYYFRALEAFMEFMSDLGLYQVMEQCLEIYKIRPRSKKKNRYRRGGKKDALDDTTDEEAEAAFQQPKRKSKPKKKKKVVPAKESNMNSSGNRNNNSNSDNDQLEPELMFQNKHKDKDVKVRAIMDNGWTNGFSPGEEIKDPNTKKANKKKNKDKISRNNKLSSKNKGKSGDGDDSCNGENDDGDGHKSGMLGDSKHRSKSSSKDKMYNTDTTHEEDDEDEDGGASSEEEEEEEEDYIYYFDPNQAIVGKLSRSKCLEQKLIVSGNRTTGKETYDGLVDHWDSKQENNNTIIPGKTELIGTLKEVLRGKAVAT